MNIVLKSVKAPEIDSTKQVYLNDETMKQRKDKVMSLMEKNDLDFLIVYCDLEHGGNFEYLTGLLTRFEEGLLIIGKDKNHFILGNENLNKGSVFRIENVSYLYSEFSLPDQPNMSERSLRDLFIEIGMENKNIGICGWKKISKGFDIPSYIVDVLRTVSENLSCAIDIFIGNDNGARITNNANEIAHYEYGASLASKGILNAYKNIKVGMKEKQLASYLQNEGQHPSVITIVATGKRFENANVYPSEKQLMLGDPLSLTIGYKGGLQSRSCFVANDIDEVADNNKDYLEKIAIPYFGAVVTWLENIKIGMKGKELYEIVDDVLPKDKYNWKLNPGHLCADEEWLCSIVSKDSDYILKSGMILQFDIIPSIKGLSGVSVEGGIALADEKLKSEIKQQYPDLYQRFINRRKYIKEVLGIDLSEDVLPMGNADCYYKPFVLSEKAFVKES